jgi:HAD superfamily hydrolase (TIGR01509 family)
MLNKFTAVIFDMDGVLLDSSAVHNAAFLEILRPLGVVEFDYAEQAGRKTFDVLQQLNVKYGWQLSYGQISELAAAKSAAALKVMRELNPVFPGACELVTLLSKHLPVGLASSGSRHSVESFIEINKLGNCFSSVLSSDDVSRSKPDPEIYRKSCKALQMPPSSCVVIEDAVAGVTSARQAGTTVYGLATTTGSSTLLAAGASGCLDKLEDIAAALGLGF